MEEPLLGANKFYLRPHLKAMWRGYYESKDQKPGASIRGHSHAMPNYARRKEGSRVRLVRDYVRMSVLEKSYYTMNLMVLVQAKTRKAGNWY